MTNNPQPRQPALNDFEVLVELFSELGQLLEVAIQQQADILEKLEQYQRSHDQNS